MTESDSVAGLRPRGYPAELESEVLLSDGHVAEMRPILPSDEAELLSFADRLSAETVYLRFFSRSKHLTTAEARHFVTVDYVDRLALVALVDGGLAAVARYERLGEGEEGEVAFTVRDDQQGRGLGTVLLEHLASAALARGIRTFVADTLPENHRMLGVFRAVGFVESARFDSGVIRVTISLEPVSGYLEKVEERDRSAAVRSVASLLEPRSVAVIGASPRAGTVGNVLVANILGGGFTGELYPVHPTASHVLGLRAYSSMTKLPGPVDLAIIAVPADEVPEVVAQCGRAGTAGLVIVSAGFAESGPKGAVVERDLVYLARRHGMRLIGPNCMGLINTADHVRLDATFAPVAPVPGRIAFSSQSGGLGIAILAEANRRGLGISSYVSVGNKSDVSGNDLIRYWEADPGTDVILLYLESFGNPRHFSRIARRAARKKPIVAVKAGRSPSGSRGALSHTAAREIPDAVVDALFRQAGVIRVETLEELFDVAEVLSHQPLPAGGRVAIVGNAGGPGVLAADACEGHGLTVPLLSGETQRRLAAVLSPDAGLRNPVDCAASASSEQYRRALEIVLGDDGIDAAIVIFTPPLVAQAEEVAGAIAAVAATSKKPIVANFLATSGTLEALRTAAHPIPWFAYPESAARALAKVVPYARWLAEPEEQPAELVGVDIMAARRSITEVLASRALDARDGYWLDPDEVRQLLASYSIPVSDELPEQMRQPAAPEMVIGLVDDPSFGPLVTFGLAGMATEVLGDIAFGLPPLSHRDALAMIRSIRAEPLLAGERGLPPVDLTALADLACRVGRLAEDLPDVFEMRLSPVVSVEEGYRVLGAEIRLLPIRPEAGLRRRRLR
ncbi:MAG: bifunctional acetate--CoA ligase family protein/GNAT family N-acetyltransferase [Acidimicrobiales bacterium]